MASTYLSRTSGSPTNALKFTYSFWVKLSALENDTFLLDFNTDGNNRSNIGFETASKQFIVYEKLSGSTHQIVATSRVFRDPSAWYHIVASCDKTLATASDRTKIYVNGVRETSLSQTTYPAQNTTGIINTAVSTLIGKYSQGSLYLDGSLTHVHFVDGTAYDASTFGESDSVSGIWKPKTAPSVTYGTNGFFLKFENSGAMGTDSSGNSNTFTVSGTLTQNVDTPSNNFATLNPLDVGRWTQSNTFSNGNLTVTTSDYLSANGSLAVSSGKFYWEVEYDTAGGSNVYAGAGIINYDGWDGTGGGGSGANTYIYATSGQKVNNASGSAFGATLSAGDIVGVALDLDNGFLYFSKNGTWQNSGDPTSGATGTGNAFSSLSGTFTAHCNDPNDAQDHDYKFNFGNGYFATTAISSEGTNASGNGKFEYDVPTGYTALSTKGLNL